MMKINLELVTNDNGARFLNFWNYQDGEDLCCEIDESGKLFLESGKGGSITLIEFVKGVEQIVKERNS